MTRRVQVTPFKRTAVISSDLDIIYNQNFML
jgi:hypothetical protein